MFALEKLGRFVAELSPEALPAATARAARLQILNNLAAACAARGTAEAEAVRRGLLGLDGGGRATIVTTGERASVTTAAAVNAAASMAHDFDDIVWMGHTGHSAVFASLAVAEHERRSSRDFVTAVVAANEVAGRLGASAILGPLNGQMVTFIHAAGAAAAAAKLLGLDAVRTTHALGIALSQPPFGLQAGFMGAGSKLLSASTPLVTGLLAAYAARDGLTGHPGLLEDKRGFWRHFAFIPLPHMIDDLGELWVTETLQLKTYPGCHYFQTACTALEELLGGRAVRLEDVERITVSTTKLACEVTQFGASYANGALDAVSVNFDLRSTLAVLLHAGRLTPAELEPAWLEEHAPAIRAWRERIDVRHDPKQTLAVLRSGGRIEAGRRALKQLSLERWRRLAKHYREAYASSLVRPREALGFVRALVRGAPRPERLAFPSRVTLQFSDGGRAEAEVLVPVGDCAAPGVEAALERKLAMALGDETRAKALLHCGLALGEEPIETLLRLAAPARAAAVRAGTGAELQA